MALIGPDRLTGDLTGDEIAFVLDNLKFGQGLQTVALDKAARDYLRDSVVARIGGRSR
jgi:hypothetical protein